MMDLKEIIKWFIPCFHVLQIKNVKFKTFLVFLFLFCNLSVSLSAEISSLVSENNLSQTKNLVFNSFNVSEVIGNVTEELNDGEPRTLTDASVGRTFGRPFKKMIAGLLPVIFQIGAASTWAVVAALIGVKTLLITMFILKILLVAGAAKLGALFANKQPHHGGWQPPHQKEIHLHIHSNGHEHHEEHFAPTAWNREGITSHDTKIAYVYDPPYRAGPAAGPQTISTPFGNYVKIDTAPTSANSLVSTNLK